MSTLGKLSLSATDHLCFDRVLAGFSAGQLWDVVYNLRNVSFILIWELKQHLLTLAGALGLRWVVLLGLYVFSCGFAAVTSPGYQQPSFQRLPSSPRPLLLPHLIFGGCSRSCFAVTRISDAHKYPMSFISSTWDALPHQHRCLSTSEAGQELFITFKASQQGTFSRLNTLSSRIIRKIFSAHWGVQLEVTARFCHMCHSQSHQNITQRFSIF